MNTHNTVRTWRKSQRCDNHQCVEVARVAAGVALRDSSLRDGPVLMFSPDDWAGFVAELRAERWRRS